VAIITANQSNNIRKTVNILTYTSEDLARKLELVSGYKKEHGPYMQKKASEKYLEQKLEVPEYDYNTVRVFREIETLDEGNLISLSNKWIKLKKFVSIGHDNE
jgi:hypothetical protein